MKSERIPRLALSQLRSLDAKTSLVEADKTIDVEKFAQAYEEFKTQNNLSGHDRHSANEIWLNIKKFDFIKQHCPPIRYIGGGSERMVYACDGRTCFKLSLFNDNYQNKQEVKTLKAAQNADLKCFPKLIDASNSMQVIEVECCAVIDHIQLQKMLGLEFDELIAIVSDAVVEDKDYDAVIHHIENISWTNQEKMINLMMQMENRTNAQAKVLDDLVTYQIKYGQLFDVDHIDNWGIAIRDNKEVVLPIDVGS